MTQTNGKKKTCPKCYPISLQINQYDVKICSKAWVKLGTVIKKYQDRIVGLHTELINVLQENKV